MPGAVLLLLFRPLCLTLQSRASGKGRRGDVHAQHDKHAGEKGAGQQQGRPPRGPQLGPKHGFYGSSLPKRSVVLGPDPARVLAGGSVPSESYVFACATCLAAATQSDVRRTDNKLAAACCRWWRVWRAGAAIGVALLAAPASLGVCLASLRPQTTWAG